MSKSTFALLFASPILQTLYRTDRYTNQMIDIHNMDNNELQQSLVFIERLIRNKAVETYSLLSTCYDIENISSLHRDLIIEILKWSYDTNEYLGDELLNTKHFTAPIFRFVSFISFIIEPIHIINVWILIILYIIPYFLSKINIKLHNNNNNNNCSIYDYIVYSTMRIQYFVTIIHLILCQIFFFINALMPLRSFVRWRRYYKIYLNHCDGLNANQLIYNNYDDEPMKLLLFPYHKLTLHGKITDPDYHTNNITFTWWQFAQSYTLYVFNLYIYNIWSIMYSQEHMFLRRISHYECLTFIIYILPLIFAAFLLDNNSNMKQKIKMLWNQSKFIVIILFRYIVLVLSIIIIILYTKIFSNLNNIGYIRMLIDFLLYLFNFIQIIACTIIGYIHIEWSIKHVYTSIFGLNSRRASIEQTLLIASNTIAITIWILSNDFSMR